VCGAITRGGEQSGQTARACQSVTDPSVLWVDQTTTQQVGRRLRTDHGLREDPGFRARRGFRVYRELRADPVLTLSVGAAFRALAGYPMLSGCPWTLRSTCRV